MQKKGKNPVKRPLSLYLCTSWIKAEKYIFALQMNEEKNKMSSRKLKPVFRAIIEAGSIIFLFYSNHLMGEYSHSGQGNIKGFCRALQDIFTLPNFCIAIVSSLIGYLGIEFLRKKL